MQTTLGSEKAESSDKNRRARIGTEAVVAVFTILAWIAPAHGTWWAYLILSAFCALCAFGFAVSEWRSKDVQLCHALVLAVFAAVAMVGPFARWLAHDYFCLNVAATKNLIGLHMEK